MSSANCWSVEACAVTFRKCVPNGRPSATNRVFELGLDGRLLPAVLLSSVTSYVQFALPYRYMAVPMEV